MGICRASKLPCGSPFLNVNVLPWHSRSSMLGTHRPLWHNCHSYWTQIGKTETSSCCDSGLALSPLSLILSNVKGAQEVLYKRTSMTLPRGISPTASWPVRSEALSAFPPAVPTSPLHECPPFSEQSAQPGPGFPTKLPSVYSDTHFYEDPCLYVHMCDVCIFAQACGAALSILL